MIKVLSLKRSDAALQHREKVVSQHSMPRSVTVPVFYFYSPWIVKGSIYPIDSRPRDRETERPITLRRRLSGAGGWGMGC